MMMTMGENNQLLKVHATVIQGTNKLPQNVLTIHQLCARGEGGSGWSTWTHIGLGCGLYLSSGIHACNRVSIDLSITYTVRACFATWVDK
jgi:hypothetical protein